MVNYSSLDELGIYYEQVDDFFELSKVLDDKIIKYNSFEKNYKLSNSINIINQYSVEHLLEKWEKLYQFNRLL
jgi:hypothetical protein